jgi:hypothetical protein
MHPISVAAWISELQHCVRNQQDLSSLRTSKRRQLDTHKSPHSRKKTPRIVLGEIAANDRNMFMPSPKSIASQPKRSIEKKRMRTPSPSKNQRRFRDDAYSPDNIEDATPRPDRFARSAYPVPNLSYEEALSNEPIIEDDDLQTRSPTRSHTQSQSSNRSASPKKITSL